jgi:hypothetical protein
MIKNPLSEVVQINVSELSEVLSFLRKDDLNYI